MSDIEKKVTEEQGGEPAAKPARKAREKAPSAQGDAGKSAKPRAEKPASEKSGAKGTGGGKAAEARGSTAPAGQPRLKLRYRSEVVQSLRERFKYDNAMRVPRLVKVVVNMGVGDAKTDSKVLDGAVSDMAVITGQKPAITRARRSISNFKLREGMPIGCRVTLRGDRMWEFLDKLFHLTLPRVRDFGGISPDSFDGRGNFAMGMKEQLVFPEIDYDKIDRIRGLNVAIVTTARTDEEGRALLAALGCPFREA